MIVNTSFLAFIALAIQAASIAAVPIGYVSPDFLRVWLPKGIYSSAADDIALNARFEDSSAYEFAARDFGDFEDLNLEVRDVDELDSLERRAYPKGVPKGVAPKGPKEYPKSGHKGGPKYQGGGRKHPKMGGGSAAQGGPKGGSMSGDGRWSDSGNGINIDNNVGKGGRLTETLNGGIGRRAYPKGVPKVGSKGAPKGGPRGYPKGDPKGHPKGGPKYQGGGRKHPKMGGGSVGQGGPKGGSMSGDGHWSNSGNGINLDNNVGKGGRLTETFDGVIGRRAYPKGVPKVGTKGAPKGGPRGHPKGDPKGHPKGGPKGGPKYQGGGKHPKMGGGSAGQGGPKGGSMSGDGQWSSSGNGINLDNNVGKGGRLTETFNGGL
jgi:hypothetical protein